MNLKKYQMYQKLFYRVTILLIVFGIVLRFINLRYGVQFTWDQENSVAMPAREILVNHKIPLIGAKTGVGDLFLSPFYTYAITPFFALFGMDPVAGAVSAGIFALITIIVGYFTLNARLGKTPALLYALIWSVSPIVVTADRVPWNVNLLPLATILTFVGIWELTENKNLKGWVMVGTGIFLGANAHFSVVFLVAFAGVSLFLYRLIRPAGIAILIAFVAISILPIVVFNFRHDNILAHNLSIFLTSSNTPWQSILARTVSTFFTSAEMIGIVSVPEAGVWLARSAGIIILIMLVLYRRKPALQRYVQLFTLIFIIYLLGFTLYGGNVPEYYYLGLTTIGTIGIALLSSYVLKAHHRIWIPVVSYTLLLLIQSGIRTKQVNDHSIGVKSMIVDTIKSHAGDRSEVEVVYDMDLGWSFGFDYLFWYKGLTAVRQSDTDAYWISYPADRFPTHPDVIDHKFAVGYPTTTATILTTKYVVFYSNLFRMRIPRSWAVLSCPSIDFDRYILSSDQKASCDKISGDMMILNLPNCQEAQFSRHEKVELRNGLWFYIAKTGEIADLPDVSELHAYVASFEQNRCLAFIQNQSRAFADIEPFLLSIRLR